MAAIVGVAQTLNPSPSYADLWGADLAPLSGILAETTATVASLGDNLAALGAQLEAMNRMLSKLNGGSFDAIVGLIHSNEIAYDELVRDLRTISYRMDRVSSDFRSVYGSDYRSTPSSDFSGKVARWNDEILASAEVAARSQTAMSTLKNNSDRAESVLRSSANADGEVAQMQAIVQMLGIIQSQNNTIIQSLTAAGRVTSNVAAAKASDEQLARETRRRVLDGYRDRGPAVPPMTKLP